MTIINLTPHGVNIVSATGSPVAEIPASGNIARVSVRTETAGSIAGIPTVKQIYGKVEGLPEPSEGIYYIVSALVVAAARAEGRTTANLLTPAEQVRNEAGAIIGCRSLNLN